jgi:hypothetical protein
MIFLPQSPKCWDYRYTPCLAWDWIFFTQHDSLESDSSCCVYQYFIPFYWWVVYHGIDRCTVSCSFIHLLKDARGYYKVSCYERLWFSHDFSQEYIAASYSSCVLRFFSYETIKQILSGLYPFPFPTAR